MIKDIVKIIELFWYATGLPIRVYTKDFELISEKILASQMPVNKESYIKVIQFYMTNSSSKYYTNTLGEHFMMNTVKYEEITYHVLCGPAVSFDYTDDYIRHLYEQDLVSFQEYKRLKSYFRSLPRFTSLALRKVEPLLMYLLDGNIIDINDISRDAILDEELVTKQTEIKETISYHHTDNKMLLFFEAIKEGDRKKIHKLLSMPDDGPAGILCTNNPLRSYKNLFITSVSQASLAAILGGVDSETSYTLSDSFIQLVEEVKDYEEITELFKKMLHAYVELVEKVNKIKYTKPVYRTIEYIKKHYSEDIKVSTLADNVHLSQSHLLHLFKDQLKISIKDYIIQHRIKEVKNLLKYSHHSIASISEMTGFSDQSYLTRVFKKLTHSTPKQYRNASTD